MVVLSELTPQEHKVLKLVAKGWRNTKIAGELAVSTRTIENHLYHIFNKLDVSSRTEAALYILSSNLNFRPDVRGNSDDMLNNSGYPS